MSRLRALTLVVVIAGCAAHQTDDAPAARAPISIPLEILKPDGAGPFPAVVLLHDCSGLGPRSSGATRRWARELVGRGYVVAIPDSFSTRGFPGGVCSDPAPRRVEVGPFRRVRDAYETLDHLRTLRYVDGSRVGVMGGSHGGSTTLATLSTSSIVVAQRLRPGFIAAVALYPGCAIGNPRFNGNAPGGRGATTGGNAEACADSIREVRAFFERELRSR